MNQETQSALDAANALTERFIMGKRIPDNLVTELKEYMLQTRLNNTQSVKEACTALNRLMLILGQAKAGNMYEAVINGLTYQQTSPSPSA